LKYPVMFREADCLLITKVDLAPYVEVQIDQIIANVRQINPKVQIFPVSAKTGQGLTDWFRWVRDRCADPAPRIETITP
ncbi:MAG: hydrogenase accessory protein HypB, partial [Prochlorothrix sp.]